MSPTQLHIDRLLDYLTGEYEWAISASDRWSEDELFSFITEQPLRDEALDDLGRLADECLLSPLQARRLAVLRQFLTQHQTALEYLLDT